MAAASEFSANPRTAHIGAMKNTISRKTDLPLSSGEISIVPSLGHSIVSFTKLPK